MPSDTKKSEARREVNRKKRDFLYSLHDDIWDIFNEIDRDCDGDISKNEFKKALNMINIEVSDKKLDKIFKKIRTNEDDPVIDLEEFAIGIHMAYPEFDILWKQLYSTNKYEYIEPGTKDIMGIEECKSVLSDNEVSWKERTIALRTVLHHCTRPTLEDDDMMSNLKRFNKAFFNVLRSENEMLVFITSITLAKIAKCCRDNMKVVVNKLLNVLWELLDHRKKLITYSVDQCIQALIRYVPDKSDNMILKTICQGCNLKGFDNVQVSCFESLIILIEKTKKSGQSNEFWKKVKDTINKGVLAATKSVQNGAFKALYTLEKVDNTRGGRLVDKLDKQISNEYTKWKKEFKHSKKKT